jgi:addiction module HigA family antidote
MRERKLKSVHPGEVLLEEFLRPLGLSQYRLAKNISVPLPRINEIVKAKRGITADTALRLARFFRTSEHFWLNLQAQYDLETEKDKLGRRLIDDVAIYDGVRAGDERESIARSSPRAPQTANIAPPRSGAATRSGHHAARKAR